ncbi:hypothetical protein ACVITL_006735 [Rhizobium pisi]
MIAVAMALRVMFRLQKSTADTAARRPIRPQEDQSCMRIILNMTQVRTWISRWSRSEEAQMVNCGKLMDIYANRAGQPPHAAWMTHGAIPHIEFASKSRMYDTVL